MLHTIYVCAETIKYMRYTPLVQSHKDKVNAVTTGLFFILAAVSSMLGLYLYQPLLSNNQFLEQGFLNHNAIVCGALCELILSFAAVGTSIMLYPYLKVHSITWGMGYVMFRLLEASSILLGTISVLSLLSLSNIIHKQLADANNYTVLGELLKAVHSWTFIIGPNFMLGINTAIYSMVFYKARLVPRGLALLGILGAISVFIAAILELFGIILQISTAGFLLALPIFLYEMSLASWLIFIGKSRNR